MNHLYLGDCLNVLRNDIPDESVDLIYIDPPFNSKRDYNIFFDSKEIQTQRVAFEDTWTLKSIQESLSDLHNLETDKIYKLLITYQEVAPHAFPYLVMMALRIIELHKVLKPTGSFYLHCDSTMSHYLKTICDIVFGAKNYKNEVIWERYFGSGSSKSIAKKYPNVTDAVLFYTKTEDYLFNPEVREYADATLKRYDKIDEDGRRYKWENLKTYSKEKLKDLVSKGLAKHNPNSKYPVYKRYLEETKGTPITNLWNDLKFIGTKSPERLGYPTQKPKALLERIIQASSNEGDTVLDAFCGCGTTVDAAESLHRQWIGIDVSPIAISLIKRRLKDAYKDSLNKFEVRGTPTDEQSAIRLWKENAFAFQDWWLTEFEVFSTTEGTKGADKGIDGIGQYLVGKETVIRVAYQVKGGKVQSKDIDALIGVLSKHKCDLGIFLTLESPTKPMMDTAAGQGFVEYTGFKFPKIQILTLKDFFDNKRPKLPKENITFRKAQTKGKKSQQFKMEM